MTGTAIEVSDSTGMLRGFRAIADFTGLTKVQVMAFVADGELPHFKSSGRVCADRDAVLRWARARFSDR